MKVLKSLILGAAAICAVSWGAQAADLPVKAKPVEYVKICSAYGAGFYYIPGTEICLRVGGYMWYDLNMNQRGEGVDIGNSPQVNSDYGPLTTRVRAVLIMDARTNTQYGTLRSYVAMGEYWTSCNTLTTSGTVPGVSDAKNGCKQSYESGATGISGDVSTYIERAFIQIAGFTFGYVGSFFDFSSGYNITSLNTQSFKWSPAIAYTIQFGGGLSSTWSLEDPTTRRSDIGGGGAPAVVAGQGAGGNLSNNCTAGLGNVYGGGMGSAVVWSPVPTAPSGMGQWCWWLKTNHRCANSSAAPSKPKALTLTRLRMASPR